MAQQAEAMGQAFQAAAINAQLIALPIFSDNVKQAVIRKSDHQQNRWKLEQSSNPDILQKCPQRRQGRLVNLHCIV